MNLTEGPLDGNGIVWMVTCKELGVDRAVTSDIAQGLALVPVLVHISAGDMDNGIRVPLVRLELTPSCVGR